MEETEDVEIIGAGPAGLIAGINFAKKGHEVKIWEEHEEIGKPVQCAGIISKEALESMVELKSRSKIILNEIYGAKIYSPQGIEFSVDGGDVKAYVVDRHMLDSSLGEQYVSEGGKLMLGEKAKPHKLEKGVIVGADGPNSIIARHFSFPDMPKVFGYQIEAEGKQIGRIIEKNHVKVFLSHALFPGFFGWVIPLNEEKARIGFAASRGTLLYRHMKSFLKKLNVEEKVLKNAMKSGGAIPLKTRSQTTKTINKKKICLVGDAAGQVKATTGGGIFFGTSCARLLGSDIGNYEGAWRKNFSSELLFHQAARRIMNSLPDKMIDRAFSLMKEHKVNKFLEKYGSMDFLIPTIKSLPKYFLS